MSGDNIAGQVLRGLGRASLCHGSTRRSGPSGFQSETSERPRGGQRPSAPTLGRGTVEDPRRSGWVFPTFAHGRSGGFKPVAGVAVALVVSRKVDAEAAVAAQVGLCALVQV